MTHRERRASDRSMVSNRHQTREDPEVRSPATGLKLLPIGQYLRCNDQLTAGVGFGGQNKKTKSEVRIRFSSDWSRCRHLSFQEIATVFTGASINLNVRFGDLLRAVNIDLGHNVRHSCTAAAATWIVSRLGTGEHLQAVRYGCSATLLTLNCLLVRRQTFGGPRKASFWGNWHRFGDGRSFMNTHEQLATNAIRFAVRTSPFSWLDQHEIPWWQRDVSHRIYALKHQLPFHLQQAAKDPCSLGGAAAVSHLFVTSLDSCFAPCLWKSGGQVPTAYSASPTACNSRDLFYLFTVYVSSAQTQAR